MNLRKIQSALSLYAAHLAGPRGNDDLFHWEVLRHFQANWETEAEDLAAMYDASLQSSISRRLWKGHDFHPKEMMLRFIRTEPEYVRLAFRDLFNENKSIQGRVDRFLFYCDELLSIHSVRHPKAKENGHYHTPEMVMVYLAFRFPETYSLYDEKSFRTFLRFVDAREIPSGHDLERYVKVGKVLDNLMGKNAAIQAALSSRLDERHYGGKNLLAIHGLMQCL